MTFTSIIYHYLFMKRLQSSNRVNFVEYSILFLVFFLIQNSSEVLQLSPMLEFYHLSVFCPELFPVPPYHLGLISVSLLSFHLTCHIDTSKPGVVIRSRIIR